MIQSMSQLEQTRQIPMQINIVMIIKVMSTKTRLLVRCTGLGYGIKIMRIQNNSVG